MRGKADQLRKLLRANGIEVDDRDRSWPAPQLRFKKWCRSSRDGRKGARPNHNDPMEDEETLVAVPGLPGISAGLPLQPAQPVAEPEVAQPLPEAQAAS